MLTILSGVGAFLLVFAAMSLGVLLGRKPIKSCGGGIDCWCKKEEKTKNLEPKDSFSSKTLNHYTPKA